MSRQLPVHGSEAGYRAEVQTDSVCDRCIKGHRVFQKQYTKAGKKAGIKYGRYQALDHLYSGPGRAVYGHPQARTGTGQAPSRPAPARVPPAATVQAPTGEDETGADEDTPGQETGAQRSLADRVGEGLRQFVGNSRSDEYVPTDGPPDYLHEIDPDDEPSQDYHSDNDEEIVINKAAMELIEDNLGTYLSVVGITMEMIDPYCGPILAENFENIVGRWTKVIAKYPRAAKLFMSKDGGVIMTWIGALQATWPVLLAVYEHHLAKTVQTDREGRSFKVRNPGANGHPVDATMPPMPGYNYTVD